MLKKKKSFLERLSSKYRLVIMNDATLEEKISLRLSRLNVFVFTGTIILVLITLVIFLIAFTPLREYIPGYADVNMQRNVYRLAVKADSLEQEMAYKDKFIRNLKAIISGDIGKLDTLSDQKPETQPVNEELPKALSHSPEDSALRAMIETADRYQLSAPRQQRSSPVSDVSSFFFFTPVKGSVTQTFSSAEKHYGVDVAAPPNEAIKAALDGTVILSEWTSATGYVIGIQHSNNLLTLYKHNSALLKKTGAYVKAGEAVAIIGNSGEYSSGTHLHFELWYNGTPVNPLDYIAF